MHRRSFIERTALASGAFLSGRLNPLNRNRAGQSDKFRLHYAPHLGMFKHLAGSDPLDQLHFMADNGFTAFEDNGMKQRDVGLQEDMAVVMRERELKMGVFVAHTIHWDKPSLTTGDGLMRQEFLSDIKASVDVAKRVGAKWMTVVPGHVDLSLEMGYQTANVVETLRQACAILEPHGLVMVLEPLNWWANHAGQFLTTTPQAYQICKAVNSASCKILFDVYHQQISEGNLIPNMDKAWDEIAYIQVGDNPGRNEPTTGEINYLNVFKYLNERNYQGIIGMEHGNSGEGADGELAVIEAYQTVDKF